LTRSALLAGFAAGSLAAVLIVINNLRDIAGDRRSNKRTLAARFGERFARAEVVFFALAPFVAVGIMAWMLGQWALMLTLEALPLAFFVIARAFRSEGAELNRALAIAGGLQWAFGLLFVAGSLT
jgi:1,4-dihydroxy-2-naphthoate octaprenyltransferase